MMVWTTSCGPEAKTSEETALIYGHQSASRIAIIEKFETQPDLLNIHAMCKALTDRMFEM